MTNEQLVTLIRAGVDTSVNMLQLWQQNRGIIGKIANVYRGYEEIEDLEQQGYIGLCNAVEGYKLEENIPFVNYAAFWIRHCMTRYIETSGNIIRIPSHAYQDQRKYKRLIHEFEMQLGRKPCDSEICRSMEISRKELESIRDRSGMGRIGSLDCYITDDGETTVGDLVPGNIDVENSVLNKMEKEELKQVIWPMVDSLSSEQSAVLYSLYKEGKSLKETSETTGISLSQVRTVREKAFRELKRTNRRRVLENFLPEATLSIAYRHNGIKEFNRTWTSSTELAAMKGV